MQKATVHTLSRITGAICLESVNYGAVRGLGVRILFVYLATLRSNFMRMEDIREKVNKDENVVKRAQAYQKE